MNSTIYPGIADIILQQFSSAPLTMENITGSKDSAIVGWAFTKNPKPAESRISRILNATKTPIREFLQAGQSTTTPAGLPISLVTGKLAADQVIKKKGKGI